MRFHSPQTPLKYMNPNKSLWNAEKMKLRYGGQVWLGNSREKMNITALKFYSFY